MATDFTAWEKDILGHIQGVPEPGLNNAVRDACREFLERTLLWTETLTAISIVADQQDYTLTVTETDAEMISVDNVKYKEDGADNDQYRNLDPVSEVQKDLHDSGNWKFAESTSPTGYFNSQQDITTLSLYPIPTEASTSGLLVRVNIKPDDTCTAGPDFLYNFHREAIADGALRRLYSQRRMPWYDPNLSVYHRGMFESQVGWVFDKKLTGGTKRQLRVKMRKGIGL